MISPHVLPDFRRHGIGSALMQAAVEFAEELGIAHVGTAVPPARDSNRFMARLSLGPAATLRVAPTGSVKNRLFASHRPMIARGGARQLTQCSPPAARCAASSPRRARAQPPNRSAGSSCR